MLRKKSDAPTRDWCAKGDVRKVLEEYLTECPEGSDQVSRIFYQYRRNVLQRLAGDERARSAISTITKTAGEICELADLCMDAEWLMRTFPKVLTEERKMVERLRRHRQSVKELREFMSEVSEHPDHPVVGWVPIEAEEKDDLRDALNRIAALIELRQQTAEIAMVDLRVNRKSAATRAAENAAIGGLVASVMHTFGRPFAPQVATLAEVALGIGEVSEDRVREALKVQIK